jgi:hypothetical protein
VRQPPPDSASLRERARSVLTDLDPERVGGGASAYDAVAVAITNLLQAGEPVTVEDVGGLWAWAFGDDAWLLQAPHRFVLDQLTQHLQHLQPSAPSPGEVSRPGPGSTGRWLVRSRGTVHVLDLDARTYERRPGPTSQAFPYDNQAVPLTRIEVWPEVGHRMLLWFDDPAQPETLEHYRVCSRIRSISPAGTEAGKSPPTGRPEL